MNNINSASVGHTKNNNQNSFHIITDRSEGENLYSCN